MYGFSRHIYPKQLTKEEQKQFVSLLSFPSLEACSCCGHRLIPKGFVTSLLHCGMLSEKSKKNSIVATSQPCLCRLDIRQQRPEKQLALLSHMASCSLCGGGVLIYWL